MNKLNKLQHRLKIESKEMEKDFPQFQLTKVKENEFIWYISFKGAENTLYANENFKLKFEFSLDYVSKNLIFN